MFQAFTGQWHLALLNYIEFQWIWVGWVFHKLTRSMPPPWSSWEDNYPPGRAADLTGRMQVLWEGCKPPANAMTFAGGLQPSHKACSIAGRPAAFVGGLQPSQEGNCLPREVREVTDTHLTKRMSEISVALQAYKNSCNWTLLYTESVLANSVFTSCINSLNSCKLLEISHHVGILDFWKIPVKFNLTWYPI